MTTAASVTKDWIASLLPQGGYTNIRFSTRDPEVIVADHPTRPNITLRARPELGLITVVHSWRLKKPGWGGEKDLLVVFNKANSTSWYDTFYRDNEGDLIVSSYITIADGLSEQNVLQHLDREASSFRETINVSELVKWMP
ncbi:MAG: YbjN domain-containing protein [Acidobacteriota bacterium]